MGANEESFDALRESIGFGKWQYIQFIFLTGFYLAWSNNGLGILILGFVPDFACLPAEEILNDTLPSTKTLNLTYGQSCEWYDQTANSSSTCSGRFVYAEPKQASIVSEWDLVCGHTYLVDLSQTMFNAGYTVGSIAFTFIADKYGRRKVVIWGHLGFLLVGLANCLANTIAVFIIMRFFLGFLLVGTGMVGWVVTLELFTAKHRMMAARVAYIIWGVCICCAPALGYLMKGLSWRYVQLAMCSYCIVIVGQFMFTNDLTYSGLYMLTTAMSGDRYLNLFLFGVADLCSAIFLTPIFLKYGRRKMMICMHMLAAVSLISASVLYLTTDGNTRHISVTCAVTLGLFSISGSFQVVYTYTPEIYPTNIRSFGVGLTSLAARLTGFLTPFTASVAREVPWAPAAVFGGFCLLVAFISPLLPETRGKPLPQTLEDLEKLYSNNSSKSETEWDRTEDISLQEPT